MVATRRLRLAVLVSAVWLLIVFIASLANVQLCDEETGRCYIKVGSLLVEFMAFGVLPLLVLWGVRWVRLGSSSDNR